MVGLGGFEPPTSPLSGVRSNQLSYRPRSCLPELHPGRSFICNSETIYVKAHQARFSFILKEVIQPHLPIGLPCYDFTPVMNHTVVSVLLAVRLPTSGATHSHGVTGGVYKARERIHRNILICDY